MSKWKVTYILDTEEESTEVTANDEHDARYEAQRKFGSPIEIIKVEELHGNFAIKVDGEEIDHADTKAEAKRNRDTIIYGEIGTEANSTIERR